MKTVNLPGRKFYNCSGGVNWAVFVPLLLLSLAASGLLASLMYWLFSTGHYYIFIVPLISALAIGGLITVIIGAAHCRSRLIGALVGILCGLVLYIGYYYVGMLRTFGPKSGTSIQLFQFYVQMRMASDAIRDKGAPDREDRPQHGGRSTVNWIVSGAEMIIVICIAGGMGFRRARRAYCEGCNQWMIRETTPFEPEQSSTLIDALRDHLAPKLATAFVAPLYSTVPNTTVAIDYCPNVKKSSLRTCPVFMSLKQVTANSQGATLDPFESSKGEMVLRAIQLNPDEVNALLPRFPIFETATGKTAASALREMGIKPEPIVPSGPLAEISPVEPESAGKVLTKKTAIFATLLSFAALVLLFGAIAIATWGGMMAYPDKNSPTPTPTKKVMGLAALSAGGVLFFSCAAFFFINPTYFGNRHLEKRLRQELSKRATRAVDPKDPEAVFVEIVPKLNWGKMQLDNAADIGLLRLDEARHELLFEGDKERYRIPIASITSSNVEFFIEGQGSHAATKVYYVVLRANRAGGFWEAPIRARTGTGLLQARKRKKWCMALQEKIVTLQNGITITTKTPRT